MTVQRPQPVGRRVLITGTAGFIGLHLARKLRDDEFVVDGYDEMTTYCDVELKQRRHEMVLRRPNFATTKGMLEDLALFDVTADAFAPNVIVHLSGQAGVRYRLENPHSYFEPNIVGTFNSMEAAQRLAVDHLPMAPTSSVYGANTHMAYRETDKADAQLTIYAAIKSDGPFLRQSLEPVDHDVPVLYRLRPCGPAGHGAVQVRRAIVDGRLIEIYNQGEMFRDFTYINDIVHGIRLRMDAVRGRPADAAMPESDNLSPVAPFRVVNIGNSYKVRLHEFIKAIEASLGKRATRNYMYTQKGDAPATWADATLLRRLTGYLKKIVFDGGVNRSVAWYREYSGK